MASPTLVQPSALITPAERDRFTELEAVIERGMQTFVEVGQALMEIRSTRLYRETHETFAAYCRQRWGFSDSRGRQLIGAAKAVTDVTAAGLPVPKTEGEARRVARHLRQVAVEPVDPGARVVTSRPTWNYKAVERVHVGLTGISPGLLAPEVLDRALAAATDEDLAAWEQRATEGISILSKFRRAVRKAKENDDV